MAAMEYNFRESFDRDFGFRGLRRQENDSGFKAERELFDHWVGENFARYAFDFKLRLRGVRGERVFERELEVLSLANIGNAVPVHTAESTSDGLALRVEHGPLQCYVYMRLHVL